MIIIDTPWILIIWGFPKKIEGTPKSSNPSPESPNSAHHRLEFA